MSGYERNIIKTHINKDLGSTHVIVWRDHGQKHSPEMLPVNTLRLASVFLSQPFLGERIERTRREFLPAFLQQKKPLQVWRDGDACCSTVAASCSKCAANWATTLSEPRRPFSSQDWKRRTPPNKRRSVQFNPQLTQRGERSGVSP